MRIKRRIFLLWLVLCGSMAAVAKTPSETKASLFTRYETGAAINRLTEDALTLTLSPDSKNQARVGLRVCSKEPFPFALVTASADPIYFADLLVERYAYLPERIIYLRSEDCLSSQNSAGSVTEVWLIPEGATLPSHVEAATGPQVKRTSLGKQPVNRGVRDYKPALQRLIRELRAKPNATGVVFGYFLNRPSPALQGRLREVTRTFEKSGLPPSRYLVRPMTWNDEVSTYPRDKEPDYPSLFLIEITKRSLKAVG